MKFEEVVGQKNLIAELIKNVDDDRLPHALFFKGKNGYGPLPLALSLAAYLLTPVDKRKSPQTSKGYQKAVTYLHPDFHFAFPTVKHPDKSRKDTTAKDFIKEWRDALDKNPYFAISDWLVSISTSNSAGDINVAECNQIINNLSLKTFESKHKVQIIWMPEYLGSNGNKLLKLIEEPPENSVIILVGDSTEGVLNTILSRCQIINVPRIEDEEIMQQLSDRHNLNSEAARRMAFLADGDYDQAVSLLTIDSNITLNFMLEWISACEDGQAAGIRNWVSRFTELSTEERKGTLHYYLKVLREIMHFKILGIEHNKLNAEECSLIQKNVLLGDLTVEDIDGISEVVNHAIELLTWNANVRILMFQSSLEIGQIITKRALVSEQRYDV